MFSKTYCISHLTFKRLSALAVAIRLYMQCPFYKHFLGRVISCNKQFSMRHYGKVHTIQQYPQALHLSTHHLTTNTLCPVPFLSPLTRYTTFSSMLYTFFSISSTIIFALAPMSPIAVVFTLCNTFRILFIIKVVRVITINKIRQGLCAHRSPGGN